MRAFRSATAAVIAGAAFFGTPSSGPGQVVAEPALLTAGIPASETFEVYMALPENSFVLGGMIRFPVGVDVDVGGRAGLWLIDDGKDSPFAGFDLRYALFSSQLTPGGGLLNLSFDVGAGVSDAAATVWRFPLGFIAGIGFRLAGGDSEVFVHPRFDLGISSGDDDFDSALLLDVGAEFSVAPRLGALIDLRFGNGLFGEGDQVVVALGAAWRL
ncbi:MAG: hypothetical protein JSU87_04855 [Gemmatimonadota bacterium]|nr:MAG: hypothetical protein JSU87_04855 [Gemmatimonadota bacterium]